MHRYSDFISLMSRFFGRYAEDMDRYHGSEEDAPGVELGDFRAELLPSKEDLETWQESKNESGFEWSRYITRDSGRYILSIMTQAEDKLSYRVILNDGSSLSTIASGYAKSFADAKRMCMKALSGPHKALSDRTVEDTLSGPKDKSMSIKVTRDTSKDKDIDVVGAEIRMLLEKKDKDAKDFARLEELLKKAKSMEWKRRG